MDQIRQYGGQVVNLRKQSDAWYATVDHLDQKSGLHTTADAAFAEMCRYIDHQNGKRR